MPMLVSILGWIVLILH
ncbi:hypothetical protein BLA29_013510 [Euroglyphus maynei]|uniref:Uncharacterized protein n=1 Tax=Euroglyphus maynei TaxID=6958 RepID=A0A1Y3B8N9_EURMA|nr:hypothetical protein BLA29_013510 [Euroglyphus maynei]